MTIISDVHSPISPIEMERQPHCEKVLLNPYSINPESEFICSMTSKLVESRAPFMDKKSYPDISAEDYTFAVYLLPSDDEFADIARSLEGHVMESAFSVTAEKVQEASKPVENNSHFFLVVDVTNPDEPKPASSLSVADCLMGPSETIQSYVNNFGSDSLPPDLTVTDEDQLRGLWDVMAVMSPINFRGTRAAIWAYSALHIASQSAGVHRWIASMTDKEFGSLSGMGIPFKQIKGTGKVALTRPDRKTIHFGYHTINVDEIPESMTRAISELEAAAKKDTMNATGWLAIADIVHIAMDGKVTK